MRFYGKIALIGAAISIGFCAVAQSTTACYDVIPLPERVEKTGSQAFILNPGTSIVAQGEEMEKNANLLAHYIRCSTGISVKVNGSCDKPIKLRASLPDANDEAYTISVCADSVVINGASPRGLFHGIQTLRKSLPANGATSVTLPAVNIYDKPRFGYRGAHFDVSRHFYTVEEVKTFIDMMAMHNLNTFHWHLTDDQGWRIEIKKYPNLTTIGSKREETVIGRLPGKWDGKPVSGFYTQEEAKEVVRYAAERYINVIPEIDMPGHMTAALASYPHLGCTGGPYEVWTEWGVTPEVLCAGNDSTMLFIKDVLNEIMDIFPSQYIHIGGDECPKTRWAACPKCQARIKAEGITAKGKFSAEDRLQGYVTRYAYNVIKERGRVMIGWDEILESDIPSDAIVTSWRGDAGAIEGA
ncbi:MAG: beta-N-acetylhexosaminidase, partial [Muribaculaceae bacterium]